MLHTLSRILFRHDLKKKNVVGVHLLKVEDCIQFSFVGQNRDGSDGLLNHQLYYDLKQEKPISTPLPEWLKSSTCVVSFSFTDYRLATMKFENLPKNKKDKEKFIEWRLIKEWGYDPKKCQIRLDLLEVPDGISVCAHACDKQLLDALNKVMDMCDSVIYKIQPDVFYTAQEVFSECQNSITSRSFFYISEKHWSIICWSIQGRLTYFRSGHIVNGDAFRLACLDFKSMGVKLLDMDRDHSQHYMVAAGVSDDIKAVLSHDLDTGQEVRCSGEMHSRHLGDVDAELNSAYMALYLNSGWLSNAV